MEQYVKENIKEWLKENKSVVKNFLDNLNFNSEDKNNEEFFKIFAENLDTTYLGDSEYIGICNLIYKIKPDILNYFNTIPASFFSGNNNITNLDFIPNNIKEIGYRCFANCNNLTNITIPSNVEKISTDAFIDCKNLSKVNLNKKLKIIPEFIFWGCDNLELVNIPKTIKKIEKQAFYSDKNLIINYEGTKL